MWQYKTYASILIWDFVIKLICFYIDLTCVKVYIREEFATVYLLVTVFDRTEVTVCGWKGVKTPLFTDILVEKCYDRVFMSCILLVETRLNQDCSSSPNNCQTSTVCVAVSQGKECSKYAIHDIQLLVSKPFWFQLWAPQGGAMLVRSLRMKNRKVSSWRISYCCHTLRPCLWRFW